MTKEDNMDPLAQLVEWGYRVEKAQEHEGFDVYFVEGFGMSVYVRDDDEEALAALVSEEAHIERGRQVDETPEETQLRWHDDPNNDYEMASEQADAMRERVQVTRKDVVQ